MERRSVLRTIFSLPAIAVLPVTASPPVTAPEQDATAARDKGLPGGPPLVAPGVGETPITPVTPAGQIADEVIATFSPEQMKALSKLGQLLVPAWNGNPGADESGAAEFLDFLVGCSPQSRIDLYKTGLDTLNRQSQETFSKPFSSTTLQESAVILAPLREPWTYKNSSSSNDFIAFLFAAKGDLMRATVNSRLYIDAVSQTRRPRNASAFYWYPID